MYLRCFIRPVRDSIGRLLEELDAMSRLLVKAIDICTTQTLYGTAETTSDTPRNTDLRKRL